MNAVATHTPNAIGEVRQQLTSMEGQFKAALPAHMPVERFMRVVMTAVQNNPDLMKVTRRSLWNAAMRAAQDGLLPDGREGAIVKYGEAAQWMPMIGGLRKKVRNSGEIATWDVQVVHQNDQFEYELGDEPFIRHRPILDGPRGDVIAAYSVATLKSGEKSREVMTRSEIEKVRNVSRAKSKGPWVDWYEEMCRKTVARRHAKLLPMSTDLDDLVRRDDELYDFKGAREEAQAAAGGRPRLSDALDQLASGGAAGAIIQHDPETGEIEGEFSEVPTSGSATPQASGKGGEAEASGPQDGEGAGREPAPSEDDEEQVDETPRGRLIEDLRGKAMKGPKPLKLALGKLKPDEVALLTDADRASLQKAADAMAPTPTAEAA